MQLIKAVASLALLLIVVLTGCAGQQRGLSKDEVDAFLPRREFALAQTGRIRPPMPGTSYAGNTDYQYQHPHDNNFVVVPPHEHVRLEVDAHGRWRAHHLPGLEFEVTLSDDLVNTTDSGEIADRLNRYYAAELIQRGWHLTALSAGGNSNLEPHRMWATYVWTDLGRGEIPQPQHLSVSESYSTDDIRRGYFNAMIAVCVDTQSHRAHVIISLDESLGI